VPVLATIAAKGGGFIAQVKARADVELVRVTNENREGLPEGIAARLLVGWMVCQRSCRSRRRHQR